MIFLKHKGKIQNISHVTMSGDSHLVQAEQLIGLEYNN